MLALYLQRLETQAERSKFERLYLAHRQTMYYAANAILRDDALAEDAVHQAFLRLMGNLEKVEDPESARARGYLVTITRNCAVDLYNKRKNQPAVALEDLAFEPAATDDTENAVVLAIERLPEQYAAALRLKCCHGLSYEELAQILHISEENARKRIQRARRKLAQILAEMGVTVDG